MKDGIEKERRIYNQWVANETLEDYALRYSPSKFRSWSPLLLANTALGGISFLALEAIGAVLLITYGFSNAFWAIILASTIIFIAGIPISYYCARYNIDIDLLTRSAGFGYVGSTVTSLIYASFCFIFFALEAAIMAQALELYFNLPLAWGYLFCSIIIIPLVFYGVTIINKLHLWTQPIWLILMLLPFYFVFSHEPQAISYLIEFKGKATGSNQFDLYYFGIATGISFALIAQIGEQVDYLRLMPNKHKGNQFCWWFSLISAGPGWVILGGFKQLLGAFLAALVILTGLGLENAKEPVQMYLAAYSYVFREPEVALLVSTFFVIISQIKINVTNAYAGSLAWSNFFSRTTHSHPGRVVWMVFNITIALLLMEFGVFEVLHKVLGFYSNVAVAWIFAVFADLAINKPLKLSPPVVEFKRAHLYDYNPVGFISMQVASVVSILAFIGLFGDYAQAYSWLIAMLLSLILSPFIAYITKGKYYIARKNTHFSDSDQQVMCEVCDIHYAENDMAYCPFHERPICSLCCTLESNCHDECKPQESQVTRKKLTNAINWLFVDSLPENMASRIAHLFIILFYILSLIAVTFWFVGSDLSSTISSELFIQKQYVLFSIISVFVCTGAWWLVLAHESRLLAENELNEHNKELIKEISDRKKIEEKLKLAKQEADSANQAKGLFLANMSHELRTPMHGILSFSHMGLKNIDKENKEKNFKYFDRINTSGQRLLVLLNDLLDLSKLESGMMELEKKECDLGKVFESCLAEQESRIQEQQLLVKIDGIKSSFVVIDKVRIGQVITNLLSNAIKFTPPCKSIYISINKKIQNNVSVLCFSIEDEGIGIPEQELEHVFDKFIQSSKTRSNAGGTGLGLAISQEIINLHDGEIWAEHSHSGGSVFKFVLPI